MKKHYLLYVLSIQSSNLLGGEVKWIEGNLPMKVILSNLSLWDNVGFIKNVILGIIFCVFLYFLIEYLRELFARYNYSGLCGIALQMNLPGDIHYRKEMNADSSNKEENLSSCLNASSDEKEKEESKADNNPCVLLATSLGELGDSYENSLAKYFRVIVVANPDLLIGFAARFNPDAIIIDETVNGKSGDEICRKIKSHELIANIPVVLLVKAEEVQSCLLHSESGADCLETRAMNIGKFVGNMRILIKNYAKMRERLTPVFATETPSFISKQMKKDHDSMDFMDEVHTRLDVNLGNNKYTITKLSSELGLSRTLFYNKFRSITGQAPKDYIFLYKMDAASKLLLSSKYNVTDVSCMLGFCDSKYFTKRFKDIYHICPTKYVQQIMKGKDDKELV